MIQRIQSLLLLLAAISLIIGTLMPIGTITTNEAQYLYTSWSLHLNIPNGDILITNYYIGILQIILAILCIISLFMFKKRNMQSKLCIAGIIINFILLLLMLYIYPDRIFPSLNEFKYDTVEIVYNPWCISSIISLALLYMANKFILKDEKKVRETDRLR